MNKVHYVFIINPNAGRGGHAEALSEKIHAFCKENRVPYTLHLTTGVGDAITFARVMPLPQAEEVCFVACGGDGTFNEVINGGFGRPGASFAVFPHGSGNDFIKNFRGDPAFFQDLRRLTEGSCVDVDLLDCSGRLCANLAHIGLDSKVCKNMIRFKKWPFVNGTMAYNLAVVVSLLGRLGLPMRLTFDDGEVLENTLFLTAFGNGISYGGGYYPTPNASVADGKIDFCSVSVVPFYKIPKLLGIYKAGEHLDSTDCKPYVYGRRCTSVTIESSVPMITGMDGEIFEYRRLEISLRPGALRLRLPDGCSLR